MRSKKQRTYYTNKKRINTGLVQSFMVTLAHQSKLIPNLSHLNAMLEVLLRRDRMVLRWQEPFVNWSCYKSTTAVISWEKIQRALILQQQELSLLVRAYIIKNCFAKITLSCGSTTADLSWAVATHTWTNFNPAGITLCERASSLTQKL